MLDNMNFFQNENCGNEYAERLRKSKGGVYPEQILYQLEASSGTRCNLSTCPLVLKPTKLSNTDLQYEQVKNVDKSKKSGKKRKKHKQSKSRHEADKIKQVNMEESILTGLQTVIDLCGLLEKCEEQNKLKQSKNKCKQKMETNEQSVHNSCHLNDFFDLEPTMSINEPSSSKKLSNTTSIRKLFFRKSRSRVKNKELPSSSSITLLSQAVAGAESANESYYDQCLQILTSTKGSTHSQENAINKSNETHVSPSSSKKSITSPNIVFVNNMKPIKEESQGPSKHYIKPQFAMHCRLSTTVNESNDHKGSTPSRDFCCAAPAVRKSRPVLRNKSSQDDIRYYWKTKSENAKAPLSPCNVCCMRPIQQKSRLSLRNKSEVDDIHYYQKTKNESEQARRIPHSHQSESLHSLTEEKPPRNASALALVKSSTTSPCTKTPQNSEEMHSNFCYRYNRGIVQKQSCCATASSEGSCHSKCCPLSNIKRETCLSTKCFPPVEVIPVCGVKSGHYTPHSSKQSYPLYKPHMDCKRSRHGIPTVQPVVGICRSGRCGGPRLKGIKYALVKISEFVGFNTYEIMKPYRDKPKNIPTCIAEIFVTSQKKNEKPYVVSVSQKPTRINFQVPKSSTKSICGMRAFQCSTACTSNNLYATNHMYRDSTSTRSSSIKRISYAPIIPQCNDDAIINQLHAEENHLHADKNQLNADKSQLNADKNQLHAEKNQLHAEKSQLHAEKNQLHGEKNQLHADKNQVHAENYQLYAEKNQLHAEKNNYPQQEVSQPRLHNVFTEGVNLQESTVPQDISCGCNFDSRDKYFVS